MTRSKSRILCVDDHEDTSEMLGLLLSNEDYEVVTALTGEEALKMAKASDFDLYILDKNLPDGSGLELCRKLTEATPDVLCLFYTGDAYDVHRLEAIEAGADAYVAKPDIDGLIEGIRKLLSQNECTATA